MEREQWAELGIAGAALAVGVLLCIPHKSSPKPQTEIKQDLKNDDFQIMFLPIGPDNSLMPVVF